MQDKLDITNKTRSNLLKWNAQFSPELIEHFLKEYGKPGYTVLDPFLGSGTVLVESARLGLSGIGVELNPAASLLSSIYLLCNVAHEERRKALHNIGAWLASRLNQPNISGKEFSHDLLKSANQSSSESVLAKSFIIMLDFPKSLELETSKVLKTWDKLKRVVSELPYTQAAIDVRNEDSRSLDLSDNTVDLVITSPPYINVFNYHQQYRSSVELLGYDVLDIAKKEIGANRKNRSNRFKTVTSYCYEIKDILDELVRTTRKNARIIFVVGRQSNVLGTPFYNGEIVSEIAEKTTGLQLALKQERKFKNKFGQTIYEDILHFTNTKKSRKDNLNGIISSVFDGSLGYTEKESSRKLILEAKANIKSFGNNYEKERHELAHSSSRKTEHTAFEQSTARRNSPESGRGIRQVPQLDSV